MERSEPDAPEEQADSIDDGGLSGSGLTELLRPSATAPTAGDLQPGARLGDVTIVRFIAEGGMGRVYEGLQGMPCRSVAVKVIRPGLLSATAAKRFEHEAQILGRLTHPGIARIYTVGMQELPGCTVQYFVMEYIEEALSITGYATSHGLATRDRVLLFREVCRAVAHGHQRGVIHRDLKPSNILVDAHGQPKIIDFGVARSTDGDAALTTMHTELGQLVGTVCYMSPEQFDGASDDLDVRADVYSLGVVFYELLAGRQPYDLRNRAVYEVARVVKEVEPTLLSTVNSRLRGDLTTIVAKCLEKDRGRRYSSAAELEADLGRYLHGEAIAASPPRLIDAVVRLARRHRLAAMAAAGMVAAILIAIVGITLFAVRAERQRMLAVGERERADAANREAMRQLYVSNLRSLRGCLDSQNLRMARQIYGQSLPLAGTPLPLEMRILGAGVDEALVALDVGQGSVRDVRYSPDGSVLGMATATKWESPKTKTTQFLVEHPASHVGINRLSLSFFSADDRHRYVRLESQDDEWIRTWQGPAGPEDVSAGGTNGSPLPLAISSDGTRMAVHARDGSVRITARATGRDEILLDEHRGRLRRVVFSPDGSRVAIQNATGSLGLWDADGGECITWCGGRDARIAAFEFSPHGERIAAFVNTPKRPFEVLLYETSDGRRLCSITTPRGLGPSSTFLTFGPDGDRLVMTGEKNELHVWNALDGQPIASLLGHAAAVTAVAYSPDGRQIAGGATNGHVRLWNAESFACERVLLGHDGAITTLAFRPDGETLASGSHDGTVRIWSRTASQPLAVLPDVPGMTAAAFSPDGSQLAVAPRETGDIDVWHPRTLERLRTLRGGLGRVTEIVYSPDGRLVAAAFQTSGKSGDVRVWRTDTGELLSSLGDHLHASRTMTFSPDGSRLATTSPGGIVKLWNLNTGDTCVEFSAPRTSLDVDVAAVFGFDGTRVAYVTSELHDAATGRVVATMSPRGIVSCLAASPDGRVLVTGMAIGTVYLNDFVTGEGVASLVGHSDQVRSVVFDPMAPRLVTGSLDGTARLWDLSTGEEHRVFRGHEGPVEKVLITPDGRRVVTAATDGTVRIWDAATGDELCSLAGQPDMPRALAMSPDGTTLVTANATGEVRVQGLSNAAVTAARGAVTAPR
ncbi:MAG: protein kinase [Planctomycetia bacterium]|nr:protein kinase [Planctomycetia bacterium]